MNNYMLDIEYQNAELTKNNIMLEQECGKLKTQLQAAIEDMKRINHADTNGELEMCRFCKFNTNKHCNKCDFYENANGFEWRGAPIPIGGEIVKWALKELENGGAE